MHEILLPPFQPPARFRVFVTIEKKKEHKKNLKLKQNFFPPDTKPTYCGEGGAPGAVSHSKSNPKFFPFFPPPSHNQPLRMWRVVRFNSYFIIHGLNSGCFSSRDTMAYSERVGALDDLKVLSAEMKMCCFV